MLARHTGGGKREDSPINEICKELGCDPKYPTKVYTRTKERAYVVHGRACSKHARGLAPLRQEIKEAILKDIRKYRKKRQTVSNTRVRRLLMNEPRNREEIHVPSAEKIRQLKVEMDNKSHRV